MPTIREEVFGKDAMQRRRIIARRLKEFMETRLPLSFTVGQGTINIVLLSVTFDGELLHASLTMNGEPRTLYVWNPAFEVDDNTAVRRADGSIANIEHPLQALRDMLVHTIKLWRGGVE